MGQETFPGVLFSAYIDVPIEMQSIKNVEVYQSVAAQGDVDQRIDGTYYFEKALSWEKPLLGGQ